MSYVDHWNLKARVWLRELLLWLRERLLGFWVILVLLASCLQRFLMIVRLRKTVWDRRR
jgi:hypothetical protein